MEKLIELLSQWMREGDIAKTTQAEPSQRGAGREESRPRMISKR